jgi:hypothetical protein
MTEGLGNALPIEALPPVDVIMPTVEIDPDTAEPKRSPLLLVACLFLLLAAAVSAVTLAYCWWQAIHMETWASASHLIELMQPRAGSALSVLAAILMTLIGVVMTAAPAVAAFLAWQAYRFARWYALAAVLLQGLAWFMAVGGLAFVWSRWPTWVPWTSLPAAAVGALLLLLPPVSRTFREWAEFRRPAPPLEVPTTGVAYGPLPRYL